MRRVAEQAQADFERTRRRLLPPFTGGRPSPCEARIGRYCYWYDGSAQPPPEAPAAAPARQHLLLALARAQEALPGDRWIAGQQIRYLVEHGETDAAVAASRTCGADLAWCAALLGYALHSAGRFEEAERAFAVALREMPAADAARWRDITVALEDARDAAAADTLLWLGDPLLSRPGNDLRTELFARRVMAEVLAHSLRPERTSWGPDAEELLFRYGWPIRWSVDAPRLAGPESESVVGHERQPAYAFLPLRGATWRWDLRRPRPRSRYAPAYARAFTSIPAHQVAAFRRGDSSLVVASFDLRRDTLFGNAPVRVALALARDPSSAPVVVTTDRPFPTGVAVAVAPWPARLASLEVERLDSARFAVTRSVLSPVPPALLALSDLLLFEPGESLPSTVWEAADRALGEPRVSRRRAVGVYWELYGGAGDSLDVSIAVVPERRGLLGRFGQSLGLVGRRPPVTLQWTGSREGEFTGRAIELDLSRLGNGRYVVEVEARDRSGRRATTRRPVVVVP